MEPTDEAGLLRIGQLSRRAGVSEHLLRAWERRYGLLQPARSAGGFRLYSTADEDRIRRMRALLDTGLSAAQAAAAAVAHDPADPAVERAANVPPPPGGDGPTTGESGATGGVLGQLWDDLRSALDTYDEGAAQSVLDRIFADFSVAAALREVLIPYLHQLGDRWESGTASVAQEHFASNIIHGRLAGLARGWGSGSGPRAVLACPPGEHHDLALMAFGVVLARNGWRIDFLGASTPIDELNRAVEAVDPELIVLAATTAEVFQAVADELATLTEQTSVAIAGAGADAEFADRVGARLLAADPVSAAERLGRRR